MVGLDQIVIGPSTDDPALCGNNAQCDGVRQPEGVADRHDPVPHLDRVGIPEVHGGKVRDVHLDQRNVDLHGLSHQFCVERPPVGKRNLDITRLVDNVVIRQNVTVGADDEAGPETLADLFALRHLEIAVEELIHKGDRRRVIADGP